MIDGYSGMRCGRGKPRPYVNANAFPPENNDTPEANEAEAAPGAPTKPQPTIETTPCH